MSGGKYKITLQSTNSGSDRLGACEHCNSNCVEVFSLRVQRAYYSPFLGRDSFTFHGGLHLFGHEQCLMDEAARFTA